MIRRLRTTTMPVLLATILAFGLVTTAPAPAAAQVGQIGLVNVSVGDVTILEDVNVGVALAVAANICGIQVGVLAVQLQRTGEASCEADAGDVLISQS